MLSSLDSVKKKVSKEIKTSLSQYIWYKKAVWMIYDYPELFAWQGQDVKITMIEGLINRGKFEFLFDVFASLNEYNFSNKGQVGILGTDLINSRIDGVSKKKIQLKPVLPELQKIVD
jgi:hypothetical protein